MKIVTKSVVIENEEFVLISDTDKTYGDFYGTIPYTELDDEGKMKRELNGLEMCVGRTIANALQRRTEYIIRDRAIQKFISMGFDKTTAIIKAFELELV